MENTTLRLSMGITSSFGAGSWAGTQFWDHQNGRIVVVILLVEEILHQSIGSLFHYLQRYVHPRWCRISSMNSIFWNRIFEGQQKPWVKNSTSIQTKVCHSWYILSNTIGLRSIPIKWQTTGIDLIGAHMMSPLQRVTLKHNEGDTYTLKLRSKTLQFSCGFMWGIYLFSFGKPQQYPNFKTPLHGAPWS